MCHCIFQQNLMKIVFFSKISFLIRYLGATLWNIPLIIHIQIQLTVSSILPIERYTRIMNKSFILMKQSASKFEPKFISCKIRLTTATYRECGFYDGKDNQFSNGKSILSCCIQAFYFSIFIMWETSNLWLTKRWMTYS